MYSQYKRATCTVIIIKHLLIDLILKVYSPTLKSYSGPMGRLQGCLEIRSYRCSYTPPLIQNLQNEGGV